MWRFPVVHMGPWNCIPSTNQRKPPSRPNGFPEFEVEFFFSPQKKEKKEGRLSDSFRSESSSPGRAISIPGAQFFVGALCRGGKPQRGRRIVLNTDHIIIIIIIPRPLAMAGRSLRHVTRPGRVPWICFLYHYCPDKIKYGELAL